MSKASRARARACAALVGTCTLAWVHAASPAAPETAANPVARPRKVCLVLSGGGARGAAHVGVLKVLEQLRVPVDCIAGTSMGAIVGAAYASGMSVAELEREVRALTTEALFDDEPPRADRPMRRKQDDAYPFIGPEFGVSIKDGLTLPKGAVSGTALEAVLRRLVRSRSDTAFDALPIPFRAVATDIATGGMVIFKEGNLAQAVRASMSVPGVMAPISIDDRLLGDGGLVRNLPVDVAREMGADVVIAVNLGTPLMRKDQVTSALAVSAQVLNILTEQNVGASLRQLRPGDVLISPQLGDATAGDFSGMARLLPLGEAATWVAAERLKPLALDEAAYAAWASRQGLRAVLRADAPRDRPVDEVRVLGTQRVNPESVRAAVRIKPGDVPDTTVLDADLRRLYSWGDFEHLSYTLGDETGADGQRRQVLTLQATEKSWGPDYLRFGLGLQSQLGDTSGFNLLLSLRRTWMNALGAEWRTDVQMGREGRLATEWWQPLAIDHRHYLAPHARWTRSPLDVYVNDDRIATYEGETVAAGLDVGTQIGEAGDVRAGLERGRRNFRLITGDPSLVSGRRVGVGAWRLSARRDTLDHLQWPRDGSRLNAEVYGSRHGLGADQTYTRWQLDARTAMSAGAHTLRLSVESGGSVGGDALPPFEYFTLGGPLRLSGYPAGRFAGPEYRYARALYAGRLLQTPLLRGAYAGASLEAGYMSSGELGTPSRKALRSFGLFSGLDTPIGTLYFGVGFAPGGNRAGYVSLGLPQ